MNFPFTRKIKSETETLEIASEFAKEVQPGDVILLEGNLGAGKTFFVKAFASRFGIDEVTSPTFSIVNEYYGEVNIYHFDFYRIKKEVELYDIGIDEYLSDEEAITFIEWAELFRNAIPKFNYRVRIHFYNNGEREFTISKF